MSVKVNDLELAFDSINKELLIQQARPTAVHQLRLDLKTVNLLIAELSRFHHVFEAYQHADVKMRRYE